MDKLIKLEQHRRGFSLTANRESKAKKIFKILTEFSGGFSKKTTLLDIGTGDGGIAHYLSEHFNVISVDIIDQRIVTDGYSYIMCNENLPFFDEEFDIVVSNHIIEHVSDHRKHLNEIARVLKKDGLVYLATPNKFWPWEVHYRLPLIHYLPGYLFNGLLKLMKIFTEEVHLLTWKKLEDIAGMKFLIIAYSDKICRNTTSYFMKVPPVFDKILHLVPESIYKKMIFFLPTIVVILQKKSSMNHNRSSCV
jgi:ubiquinone/menaquinone biosynthesis C-methylase UbiE